MAHSFSKITFEELTPQRVICYRAISAEPEDDSSRVMQNWLAQHGMNAEGRRNFGFDVQVSAAEAAVGFRGYELGYVVPEDVKADDGVQSRLYGGGMYAVMRVVNAFEAPFESIPGGWHFLHDQVVQSAEWKPGCGLCYEEMAGEKGSDLILYHPVTAKK